jgi:hypothetical protein
MPSTDTYTVENRQSTGRKRTYVRLAGHPALRFGALALVAVVIAFVALRGSTSNAKDTSDTDPRVFAGKFLSTGFGVLVGSTPPDEVLKLYTPFCARGDKAAQLKRDMQSSQALVPPNRRVKVDGVEFGDGFEVSVTNNDYVVTLPGSNNIRLHVNGDWVVAHDQLAALDIEQSDAGDAVGHLTLEYVQGKLRVASC